MKINCQFFIKKGKRPHSEICATAYVENDDVFNKLKVIAQTYWGDRTSLDYPTIIPTVPETDPHLPEAFAILKNAGWTPAFYQKVPKELMKDHFGVRRFRHYEKGDLDKAEYLSVFRWGMAESIFLWEEIRDGLYCARSAKAQWKTRYGVPSGWNREIGTPRFVNGELKRDLEQQGLKGLAFKPVLFDHPEKARGEFWQLDSTVIMSPCSLPIVSVGDSWSPNMPPYPMEDYDDGGHFPQELVYSRTALEQMPPFDIALTHERTRMVSPDSWGHRLIVSQHCRQVMKKLKMGTVEFARVILK